MKAIYILFSVLFLSILSASCNQGASESAETKAKTDAFTLCILGTVQDAGSPHIACRKACCKNLFTHPDPARKVTALGLIDHRLKKTYLFDASPDIATQLRALNALSGFKQELPDGIFLTHAHIGHYSGLMYLGKEACDAKSVPVYAMPRMRGFLRTNGPWSQLVHNGNIALNAIQDSVATALGNGLRIIALQVPHRDEYSETVGYVIEGPQKKVLFIPDIDKWESWKEDIVHWVKAVDYAFLDATFYSGDEIRQRDLRRIPHPFVVETMALFKHESPALKDKIWFIHMNHTNPMLNPQSAAWKAVTESGFHIAAMGMTFGL